jgi:hypothetical protein
VLTSGISRASVQYFISSELFELPLPEAQVGLPLRPFPLRPFPLRPFPLRLFPLRPFPLGPLPVVPVPMLALLERPAGKHDAVVMIRALQPILVQRNRVCCIAGLLHRGARTPAGERDAFVLRASVSQRHLADQVWPSRRGTATRIRAAALCAHVDARARMRRYEGEPISTRTHSFAPKPVHTPAHSGLMATEPRILTSSLEHLRLAAAGTRSTISCGATTARTSLSGRWTRTGTCACRYTRTLYGTDGRSVEPRFI